MIYPDSSLRAVYVEGSPDEQMEGELVIDVAEEHDCDGTRTIHYFQLKHTTVKGDEPFILSDLRGTVEGFAKRFTQHGSREPDAEIVSFTIITNRPISSSFKTNISTIAGGGIAEGTFQATIEKYTQLQGEMLRDFCGIFHFEDSEGDYQVQKDELRVEIARLLAGASDSTLTHSIETLVQDKVLPHHSDGRIVKEDILKRLGISSDKDLLPAPAEWETLESVVVRSQHSQLKEAIVGSDVPVIVHASGGVGKSVFCRQFVADLAEGSKAIAYDCFGAGNYRNPSTSRHRHHDALVQIANELAAEGLCDPLLVHDTSSEESVMKHFVTRIGAAVNALKRAVPSAQLYLLIDAADNAEMAAEEYGQRCFAKELLRAKFPEECKLVMLCRTERIALLKPLTYVARHELQPFSESESYNNLLAWFAGASEADGQEFHRLTGGNPRVQANALDAKETSVAQLLQSLGPYGTSVDDQIRLQLHRAVSRISDLLPDSFHEHVNICMGMASLPPHIPIRVLADAAAVTEDAVKSFVAEIGRALWLSDSSVQFRDEPTETWFRETYCATKSNFENYLIILEPLAQHSTYVAATLPQLYLKAEQYERLITIALSDEFLPLQNPIDARNVRVARLEFAFKAALKERRYKDVVQLALRTGEEVAGKQRQNFLFQQNIDLLAALQDESFVQEIACKRQIRTAWAGSQNVYSASLLSAVPDFRGEARSYLRAGNDWLHLYFEDAKKTQRHMREDKLEDGDIVEFAYAELNINGISECLAFLNNLRPLEWVFGIVQALTRRLLDAGDFTIVDELLRKSARAPYFTIAIVGELMAVGRVPSAAIIQPCLTLLLHSRSRLKKRRGYSFDDSLTPAIISFAEACLRNGFPARDIRRVLKYYVPERATNMVSSNHSSKERADFLAALAIRRLLADGTMPDFESILPSDWRGDKKVHKYESDIKAFKEVVEGLYPWYLLRMKVLRGDTIDFLQESAAAADKSSKARAMRHRDYDTLPDEISAVCVSTLAFFQSGNPDEIEQFYNLYLRDEKRFRIPDRINAVRVSFRVQHLSSIKDSLEAIAHERIRSTTDDGPDAVSQRYIDLARAVLAVSKDDARCYFDEAINIVSKFGDEISERWDAIVALGRKATEQGPVSDELAYRFIRCAEVVGENMREKHFGRAEALQVCARLSPGAGIAALSRWRDRDIGRFEWLIEALASELVSSGAVSASVGWCMARFDSDHALNKFLRICFDSEKDQMVKQGILNDAVELLQREGVGGGKWLELYEIAAAHGLFNADLEKIKQFYTAAAPVSAECDKEVVEFARKFEDWDTVFAGADTSNPISLERARAKLSELGASRYESRKTFWKEAARRTNDSNAGKLLDAFLLADSTDYFDAEEFLLALPKAWLQKIGFKKKSLEFVDKLGEKYAFEIAEPYSFGGFLKRIRSIVGPPIEAGAESALRDGVFRGLAGDTGFGNATTYFGCVSIASPLLTRDEAVELLEYALSRFETHIDAESGDGLWAPWLDLHGNMDSAIAGFIWSALGSPRAAERWNAAHCVRALIEFNAMPTIEALLHWLERSEVGAFGSNKFPFYSLHARQYLMIALARVSIGAPEKLKKYSAVFARYALEPHALIQQFASQAAINIERAFAGTYSPDVFSKISAVGKSKHPVLKVDYNYSTDSPWHVAGTVEENEDYHFAYDFGQYWFEPLARVFRIPKKQVKDLAAHIVKNEWGMEPRWKYDDDPRVVLWNRNSHERETWHSHFEYPRADNLSFYNSYHAMWAVAAKLLEHMPIVSRDDNYDGETPWEYWLSRHTLTRGDGKWLSDWRGPLPLKRPEWVGQKLEDGWTTKIRSADFFDCLTAEGEDNIWLTVKGGWHEKDAEGKEAYTVNSALVAPQTAKSLLNALTTCSDPWDYKLPCYGEDGQIDSDPFTLKGWIEKRERSSGIDKFDPYANDVDYLPVVVGAEISEQLSLSFDAEGKLGFVPSSVNPALICEAWSSYGNVREEDLEQCGERLIASLPFLKLLCATLKLDLVIEVMIKRDFASKYRREADKKGRIQPAHKIYILSADGKLKDAKRGYQLR